MTRPSRTSTSRQTLILLISLSILLHYQVEGVSRCNQQLIASASIHSGRYATTVSHQHRWQGLASPAFRRSRRRIPSSWDNNDVPTARLVARSKTKKERKADSTKDTSSTDNAPPSATDPDDPFANPMTTQEIYSSLGPIGKCVAGSVEIAVSTCMEYITGFLGGYFLGYVTDAPRFMFQNVDPNRNQPFFNELSQRFQRMNSKSFRWAKSWGAISAAFGGFRVATRVVRGGKEDEWNTVFSTAAAGAFFARSEGPQAMARAAITYGFIMYLISGKGFFGPKKEPFEYQDQPIDDEEAW
ncbi:expressed unknown protein [Seminavis robusta]|uniref:Mitochondrial import inner membrane translocase subunit TIM22 n=1 Tax=Seminavis robusta TaxID=568900 RepID=A0A9N8DIB0_9STRA|nr:expressed unknown protein [Seminavis robusta]|eukprot:Sro104_g052720.1 n/a (299) ;mRNA; f:29094-30159